MDLNGISALVTGSASGLGAGTVRKLTSLGVCCTIFDLNEAGAKSLAEELGGPTNYVAGDVTDPEYCQLAVDQAARGGNLRVVVNCAGVASGQRVINRDGVPHDLRAFRFVQDLNVIGTFNVMTRGAAAMAAQEPLEDGERGVIINTASVAAIEGQIGQLAYSASKGAIVGMTLPAARDLSNVGIRVMAIAPGIFDTPMLGTVPEAQRMTLAESVLFPKRLGRPEDYGSLVVQIAQNSYLNGELIRLDGGIRMQPR